MEEKVMKTYEMNSKMNFVRSPRDPKGRGSVIIDYTLSGCVYASGQ